MAGGESDDRSQAPTARRLQRAREAGEVAFSREIVATASLTAGLGLAWLAVSSAEGKLAWFARLLEKGPLAAPGSAGAMARSLAPVLLPLLAAPAAAAFAAGLVQTGALVRLSAAAPDPGRLSPAHGLKRLFGLETLVGLVRSLAKLAAFILCLALTAPAILPRLGAALRQSPRVLLHELPGLALPPCIALLGMQAAIACADLAWVRLRHARRLRMSRQEVLDETKDSEGNPQIRQRLRALARARARRRMLKSVPKATLVLTNPTHYAVALAYAKGDAGAPRVTAKGVDEVAQRIREIAREFNVPVVANPPLARALYTVDIDAEIPAEHFQAVAELIAYVWRLDRRARPA